MSISSNSINIGSVSIAKTRQMKTLLKNLCSKKKDIRVKAEKQILKITQAALLEMIKSQAEDLFIKLSDKPLNKRSLCLPIPKIFSLHTFNDATAKWNQWRKDKPDIGSLEHILLGTRQMAEVRSLAYQPVHTRDVNITEALNTDKMSVQKTDATSDLSDFFSINLIEKDQENWFEVTDKLSIQ